jgi:hypothetical protein
MSVASGDCGLRDTSLKQRPLEHGSILMTAPVGSFQLPNIGEVCPFKDSPQTMIATTKDLTKNRICILFIVLY